MHPVFCFIRYETVLKHVQKPHSEHPKESYSFTFWLSTESSEYFFCPDFRNHRVSAEFKNSLCYKREAVGFTLDPKGFSVQRSEYVLKQCVNGFKYWSEVCYKMGGVEGEGVIGKIPEGQSPIHKWLKFIRTKKQNWCSGDKRHRKSHTPTLGHEQSSLKALTVSYLESS